MGNTLKYQYPSKKSSSLYYNTATHQTYIKQRQYQEVKSKKYAQHIVQHLIDLQFLEKNFLLRKNSKFLISASNFQIKEELNFLRSLYKVTFNIEKTPISLSNLHQIPFLDALHLTYQCLKGFDQLSKLLGPFHVNADLICINQNQVVKVWMSQDSKYCRFAKATTQTIMIKQILTIIQGKININTMPLDNPSLINYMYRNSNRLTFSIAINEICQFARRYNNNQIPNRLDCLNNQIYSEILISTDRIERQSQLNSQLQLQNSERTVLKNVSPTSTNKTEQLLINNQLKIRIHTFNRQSSQETESNQSMQIPSSSKIIQKSNVNLKNNKLSLKCIKK